MGTKKDIGKLFKERLGDFEQSPEAGLWDSIASELDKSKSRRITPLWYYIGGSVLLGVLAIIWFTVPAIVSNSELDSQVVTNQINVSKNDSINTILNLDVKNFVKVSVNQEGTSEQATTIVKNRNKGDDVVTANDNKNLNSEKNAG